MSLFIKQCDPRLNSLYQVEPWYQVQVQVSSCLLPPASCLLPPASCLLPIKRVYRKFWPQNGFRKKKEEKKKTVMSITVLLVLLSTHVERVSVSWMQDF